MSRRAVQLTTLKLPNIRDIVAFENACLHTARHGVSPVTIVPATNKAMGYCLQAFNTTWISMRALCKVRNISRQLLNYRIVKFASNIPILRISMPLVALIDQHFRSSFSRPPIRPNCVHFFIDEKTVAARADIFRSSTRGPRHNKDPNDDSENDKSSGNEDDSEGEIEPEDEKNKDGAGYPEKESCYFRSLADSEDADDGIFAPQPHVFTNTGVGVCATFYDSFFLDKDAPSTSESPRTITDILEFQAYDPEASAVDTMAQPRPGAARPIGRVLAPRSEHHVEVMNNKPAPSRTAAEAARPRLSGTSRTFASMVHGQRSATPSPTLKRMKWAETLRKLEIDRRLYAIDSEMLLRMFEEQQQM